MMELTGVEPVSEVGTENTLLHRLSLYHPRDRNRYLSLAAGCLGHNLIFPTPQEPQEDASVAVAESLNGVMIQRSNSV